MIEEEALWKPGLVLLSKLTGKPFRVNQVYKSKTTEAVHIELRDLESGYYLDHLFTLEFISEHYELSK